MLERYEAYADYNDVAAHLEELVGRSRELATDEGRVDWTRPWRRITLREAIFEETGIDIRSARPRLAARRAKANDIELDPGERGRSWSTSRCRSSSSRS